MENNVKENKADNLMEVKTNKSDVPQAVGPIRGGLMKRTLRELQELGIYLKNLISIEDMTLNLTWDQAINLCNFNAAKTVLRWDHTFEEALEIIKLFLV